MAAMGQEIELGVIREEFQRFLSDLPHDLLRENFLTEDLRVSDRMSSIAQGTYSGCVLYYCVFESLNVGEEFLGFLQQLLKIYEDITLRYRERCQSCCCCCCCCWLEEQENDPRFYCQRHPARGDSSGRGRPRFLVSKGQLTGLKELGFSWTKIAKILSISRSTLHRRRQELGLDIEENNYSDIVDQELDEIVRVILDNSPNSGEIMLRGALCGRSVRVQRWRLRDSIQRVDPSRKQRRQRLRIRRRVYSVPGPNSLWHLDGHHKLVRWRLVIHGAIDGFSRAVVFLRCGTNNEAATVFYLFEEATSKFHVPYRVRCDHGTENIDVARWMLTRYGTTHHPVITGQSVHNQRIERLWRDVGDSFVLHYRTLFYFMEEQFLLDPLNEIHLYALHFIYLPRINRSVEEFVLQWNNHPMRTENFRTPLQIWMEGVYQHANSVLPSVRMLLDPDVEPVLYGIDDYGPEPELQTNNHVVIPRSSIELTDAESVLLQLSVDPLADDGNHGIDLYLLAVQILTHLQH